ncbi:BRCT domain-containing protein [Flavobacterium sp. 316]|uniref:BRCT domain-containing protein n=1 Tax=Flavobacterium sp. 316 TaxID=1603293 RepID=UPI000697CBA1|nr:BRCT domain-containing protein [Flavobacterium sp. 316]
MTNIDFENKSFCFTGGLAELKRTQAEREVRARNGFSQKVINKELDYLVLGSIPSVGWKHGDYGNKIVKAKELIGRKSKLKIVSEKDFMEGLENIAPIDGGEIDEKLVIIRYKALFENGNLDIDGLEEYLELVHETSNSHVSASVEEPFIYQDLYNEFSEEEIDNLLFFQCRIVKHLNLEANSQEFVDTIAKGFESIKGLDGNLTWLEKKEGTASFAKLLLDIPLRTKL